MIAVQLLDADGAIVSTAAVDETFWAQYGSQATDYASQRGLGVFAASYPPDAGTAERNIYAWADWTNWIASTSASAKLAPAGWSTTKKVVVIGASAAGVAFAGYLAWRFLL
jgi:hypothetical protein